MIDFLNVSKEYNGRKVLNNIKLKLPRYGLVIINGPSGCGKTTLLNVLSSLLDFDGDISFDGRRYKDMSSSEKESMRNKRIGFVFQDYKLFEFETVRSNILLSIDMSSSDKEKKKAKRVEDLLKLVGLFEKINEPISSLSGGEKQRVAICRAIANSPPLLLADEPTGNLDETNSEMVMELLKKISASSLVVVVSHDEELTSKYADRVIKMKDGRVISDKYQNRNKHKEYLPVLKLKYDDKKRGLPFKFLLHHTINSIKRRKWRTMFISISTSLGLIGVGLASTLREIISTNVYRSYSSILDSDKLVISTKTPNISKDVISSASLEEVYNSIDGNKGVKRIGVYYWNADYLFPTENYLSLDNDVTKPIGPYSSSYINEFELLENNSNEIYPNQIDSLNENEIVLAMPMLVVNELCYQLGITRTTKSLSNYLQYHEVNMKFCLANESWGYETQIPIKLKGFILSSKTLIYHSNPLWNEYILEGECYLPSTDKINTNSEYPWALIKSYYVDFSSGRDDFLISKRFSIENESLDYEILDKKYCPILYEGSQTYNCSKVMIVHRTNKDDIPSYVADYCKKSTSGVYEVTYGTSSGYSIFGQSLMMGFSRSTYLSMDEVLIEDVNDNMSYIKYEDSYNASLPTEIIEGHFSKSSLNGFSFDPHYRVITGREPANFQEILISEGLRNRLKIDNPINKFIYLSFPVKETLLSNSYVSREFEVASLKIVGVTDSAKVTISHKEAWSILFFQVMLGISTFELRINNLALRISEGNEEQIINKINRAFPHLSVNAPLKEVKSSVDKICNYIEIIMLAVSITSVLIASLILFICNYLHYVEIKKDVGLVRCLGAKEKESRKFVYFHSLTMTGLSFLFSSLELIATSLILSKTFAKTLYIESVFILNPLSFVYMLLVALSISLLSSFMISTKISKLNPIECLQ
ncbi:MAG: ATP-binding cassette domain-containing protein [Bacilli bacterium]|nr:ATP-binding cassette domain-containing protein [Bacilli bacterium]